MNRFKAWLGGLREKKALNWAVCMAAVLLLPLAWQGVIEFIRAGSVPFALEYLWIRRLQLVPAWMVLTLVFALFTFAFRRPWVPALLCGAPGDMREPARSS